MLFGQKVDQLDYGLDRWMVGSFVRWFDGSMVGWVDGWMAGLQLNDGCLLEWIDVYFPDAHMVGRSNSQIWFDGLMIG